MHTEDVIYSRQYYFKLFWHFDTHSSRLLVLQSQTRTPKATIASTLSSHVVHEARSSPLLPVTPVQLMSPGIGRSMSWTASGWLYIMHLSVVYSYAQYPGLDEGMQEGNWHVQMEQAPIPGMQPSYHPPIQIPYKYPVYPCCAQCVMGIYGCLWNLQRIFQWHLT